MSIFRVRLVAPGILSRWDVPRLPESGIVGQGMRRRIARAGRRGGVTSTELTALRTELRAKRKRLEGEIASCCRRSKNSPRRCRVVQPDEFDEAGCDEVPDNRWMEHRALMKRRIAEIGPEIRSLKGKKPSARLMNRLFVRGRGGARKAKRRLRERRRLVRQEQAPSGECL